MELATVNGEKYKKLMIKEVIPAAKARMPLCQATRSSRITVVQSRTWGRGRITLKTQPAKSPDLNVNDLGFFHSIHQLRGCLGVTNGEELVEATMRPSLSTPGRL
ncbi:unnamed protein product [Discosporangium mesarthrocarpum]